MAPMVAHLLPGSGGFLSDRRKFMPNRMLTDEERKTLAKPILDKVRELIDEASNGDAQLRFALNRKVFKELSYDERGKPTKRRRLKEKKKRALGWRCEACDKPLGDNPVLDRETAAEGYKVENTRLLCQKCDTTKQREKEYK